MCLFCDIANGEIPCNKVYEDDDVVAFLDITNVPYGHTLVVPKKHFNNMLDEKFDGDDDIFLKCMKVTRFLSKQFVDSGLFTGVKININNGESAGQEIMHLHIHILPYGFIGEKNSDLKQIASNLRIACNLQIE